MTARLLGPPAALLLLVAPLAAFGSGAALNFVNAALIVALAAQGWNLLGGFGGQFSFGHAAFFGVGAYACALLQARWGVNAWGAAALAVAAGSAVGFIIGALAFRARLCGSYFALVTLAFAEMLRILVNAADFTGGAAGLLLRLDARPGNFQFTSRAAFTVVAALCVAAALLLTTALSHARFGAHLAAVRENEDAAQALGVDTLGTKLRAITVSAALTAAAGCLYVQYFLYIDANIAFGTSVSVEMLLAAIVGGVGTAAGPVVGALALHALGELCKAVAGPVPGIDLVAYGLLLVLFIAFAPAGIVGTPARRRAARRSPA